MTPLTRSPSPEHTAKATKVSSLRHLGAIRRSMKPRKRGRVASLPRFVALTIVGSVRAVLLLGRVLRLGALRRFLRRRSYLLAAWAYRVLFRRRAGLRPFTTLSSDWFGTAMLAGGIGDRFLLLAHRMSRTRFQPAARLMMGIVRNMLVTAAGVHLAAGQMPRALITARLMNLIFRRHVRERRNPICHAYFEILNRSALMDRMAREVPEKEPIDDYYLNRAIGIAHLYMLDTGLARYFLERAIAINPSSHLDHRMLGRAFLVEGDYGSAAACFEASVELVPSTVMAHQNYAGRYNIYSYRPKAWELAEAGELLIYDNLVQFAEDLFLRGRFDDSFKYYQKALTYQAEIAVGAPIPRTLAAKVKAACARFDPRLPMRLLSYEWVVQFGHIGLLDSYLKMAKLGMIQPANYVLLAPADKVANQEYLSHWENDFCIVRDRALVDELFPYQRYLGDNFMAYPSDGRTAEPWVRAAARAQVAWAKASRPPLLTLRDDDREFGRQSMTALGLPDGTWFVGLHVREGGFHGDAHGTISEHRNANIEDYFPAIEEIVSRGGYVVRLGDSSMTPLPKMRGVIDYAHSALKSPRLDLYLLAAARFAVGTTSGLTTAALSFGTPMVLVNCISNDWQIWTANTDFIVKPVIDRRTGRLLSLAETYRMPMQGWLINNTLLSRRGYVALANSADDILAAVKWKLDIALGVVVRPGDENLTLRRYREALADNPYMFGAAQPVTRFLEAHPELLRPLPVPEGGGRLESGIRATQTASYPEERWAHPSSA